MLNDESNIEEENLLARTLFAVKIMKHVSNQRCFKPNVFGDMYLTGRLPFDAQGDWMDLEGESQIQHQTLQPV